MKKISIYLFLLLSSLTFLTGCQRVAPNEVGVLVQNYGKDLDKDYSITSGRVITAMPGVSLYTLPAYEQRNQFTAPIVNKSSDNSEFSVTPRYSYRIDREQATRVVKEYSEIFNEEASLKEVERATLDPAVSDVIRDILIKTTSTQLMENGGNTIFNKEARAAVAKAFKDRGFILISFSTVLDSSSSVKASIDARNQSKTQSATLDSKIIEAEKLSTLSKIEAQTSLIKGEAITEQQLRMAWINKWNGSVPQTIVVSNKDNVSMFLPPK